MRNYKAILLALAVCLLTACVPRNCIEEGTEFLEAEQYESAIAVFEESIQKGLEQDVAYKGIGIARYELGEYESALLAFEKALQYGAIQTPMTLNLTGICNVKLAKYAEALEAFEQGITLAESAPENYADLIREMKYNEVICYEQMAQWTMAKIKVAEYLEQYPDDEVMQKEATFLKTR